MQDYNAPTMRKLKKVVGVILTIWAVVRYLPDLLESAQATAKYGRWLYAHVSIPRSGSLSAVILGVGIALIFAETLREQVHRWLPKSETKVPIPTETIATISPELTKRLSELAELKNVRIIDRGSGEERKAAWEQKPDVVLEWISGKGGTHDKIGLRNIGRQSVFNIKLGPFSWPEFQFPIPREVNVIHPDNQEIVEAGFIEKRDSVLNIGSLDSFLRDPRYSDRAPLTLKLTFANSHGALFEREFSFGFGPGGRWGPLVLVTLGQIRQLP